MKLTLVIPAYNGGDELLACLHALSCSSRVADQIILVDDASTDQSAVVAASVYGAKLIRITGTPSGPANARNLGAASVDLDTEILVFIDADVVVKPDTLRLIEDKFSQDPEIGALFGSYDDEPYHQSTVSKYRNLLHHHIHQTSKTEACTFWAGCGAIRHSVFQRMNGFSVSYLRPSIEDIELGLRMHQAGIAIRLCPEIQVKHLKRWTLTNMVRTDVFSRAIPWTHLLMQSDSLPNDLNLTAKHRINAGIAALFGASILAIPFEPLAGYAAALFALVFLSLEIPLFSLFRRTGGWRFTAKALPLHLLYNWYASAAYVYARLQPLPNVQCDPLVATSDAFPLEYSTDNYPQKQERVQADSAKPFNSDRTGTRLSAREQTLEDA